MKDDSQIQNNRILVIDDNPSIHDDFRRILCASVTRNDVMEAAESALFGPEPERIETPAFEIDSAFQGREGLELVARAADSGRPYAMAFVDVRMPPGWDGVETITQIWRAYPDLQIVICTAYSDYSWEGIVQHLGRSENLVILKKPFDNIEALQLAHALTRKWCLGQQAKIKVEDLDKMVSRRTQELQAANEQLEQEADERRRTQEALCRSEERFSKAFRSNPLGMAIYLRETERCIDANDQFLQMLGYSAVDIIGQPVAQSRILPDQQQWAAVRDLLRKSQPVRNVECTFLSASGSIRNTLLWAELMNVANETCVLLIIEDVTERRSLEKQLLQAQKMEAIGQLASGVAHDFNNILTVIQGHAEMVLMAGNLEQKTEHSLKQVSLASSRAASLTRQLLTFSRKQAVQTRVLNLKDQVESLREMLGRLISEDIHLSCDCAPNLPSLLADPCTIEQILINLVVNARDAMKSGGRISIAARSIQVDESHARTQPGAREGSYLCLSVGDTGCGIPPEVLPRIFEPFFTTKENGKGTGLGLATVYGIARQLNGWIEVQSELGKGTTMQVYLPPHDESPPAPTVEPAFEDTSTRTGTILLVEDEKPVRELASRIMTEAGYEVLAAGDGVEAMGVWDKNRSKVDVLLTDIVMPNGINGRQLASKLCEEDRDLKVIFTSGYSTELIGKGSLLAEGQDFLAKPFSPKALLSVLRACL